MTTGIIQAGTIEFGKIRIFRRLDRFKVHKNENFFGSDFEFCTISLLVIFKFLTKKILNGPWGEVRVFLVILNLEEQKNF